MRSVALFSCVAALASAPVAAQDGSEPAGGRSAADAQRFIGQLLLRQPPTPLSYKLYRNGSRVAAVGFGGGKVVPASGDIVSVESPNNCTTRFGLEQAQIAQLDPGETTNFRLGPGVSPSDFTVDWSKAASVDLQYTSTVTRREASGQVIETFTAYPIYVAMEGGWQEVGFRLPNEEERTRLSLAIEVLRASCCFQSDTGF